MNEEERRAVLRERAYKTMSKRLGKLFSENVVLALVEAGIESVWDIGWSDGFKAGFEEGQCEP